VKQFEIIDDTAVFITIN